MSSRKYRRAAARKLILLTLAAVGAYLLWLPDVDWLKRSNPNNTSYIDLYVQRSRKKGLKPKVLMHWRPLSKISIDLQHAVLISEDDMFYQHRGVDWDSVRSAAQYDWEKRRLARGASTISQQVARNLFLTPSKNPLRKIKEILITWKLERALGKRRILEIYLNIAEWGEGIYGAEAACNVYFNKTAENVTPDEAVALAAALPSPRRLNPMRKAGPKLLERREVILERMEEAGYIVTVSTPAALAGQTTGQAPNPADALEQKIERTGF